MAARRSVSSILYLGAIYAGGTSALPCQDTRGRSLNRDSPPLKAYEKHLKSLRRNRFTELVIRFLTLGHVVGFQAVRSIRASYDIKTHTTPMISHVVDINQIYMP